MFFSNFTHYFIEQNLSFLDSRDRLIGSIMLGGLQDLVIDDIVLQDVIVKCIAVQWLLDLVLQNIVLKDILLQVIVVHEIILQAIVIHDILLQDLILLDNNASFVENTFIIENAVGHVATILISVLGVLKGAETVPSAATVPATAAEQRLLLRVRKI